MPISKFIFSIKDLVFKDFSQKKSTLLRIDKKELVEEKCIQNKIKHSKLVVSKRIGSNEG